MENELEDKSLFTKVVLTVVTLAVLLVAGNLFLERLRSTMPIHTDGWQVLVYESGSVIGNINTLTEPSLERDKNACLTIEKEKFCGTSITITISPHKVCIDRCP